MGKLHLLKTNQKRVITLEQLYELQLAEYIEVATELLDLLKQIAQSKLRLEKNNRTSFDTDGANKSE
jgi:hypothetical protein